MAQTVTPRYNQGYFDSQQQSGINSTYVVVDQQPSQRVVFPYRLQVNWILGFSITKCIVGTLLFIAGMVHVLKVEYNTKIGAPVCSGWIIVASGIIGCTLKCKQTKCLIGSFLGLSITTLILDLAMLPFYSMVLEYFVNFKRIRCYFGYYGCYTIMTIEVRDLGTGMSSFLVALLVLELVCSIGSVVLSCRAYSKYCNTCNIRDCCTCLGCCECDCVPLNISQGTQPDASLNSGHQNIQMSSFQPPLYQLNQHRAQSNPCSDMVSFIINIPSYVFGTASGTQLSAINVTLQPDTSTNQQAPPSEHDRAAAQMQGTTSIPVRSNQPNYRS